MRKSGYLIFIIAGLLLVALVAYPGCGREAQTVETPGRILEQTVPQSLPAAQPTATPEQTKPAAEPGTENVEPYDVPPDPEVQDTAPQEDPYEPETQPQPGEPTTAPIPCPT